MRILFTVQGEGRGHMTQAIALQEILSSWGHEIVGVVAGKNTSRSLPPFFAEAFPVPVTTLPSPGFVYRDSRSVDVGATVLQSIRNFGQSRASVRQLRQLVYQLNPDLVFNFFEPLTGLMQIFKPLSVPVIAVGHQYMIYHPTYVKLPGHFSQQLGMRMFVNLVGTRSSKLALSLYSSHDIPERQLMVCPPVLRKQLFELKPQSGDYILIYLLNHGYAEEIIQWHQSHRDTRLHCFYDKPGAPEEEQAHENLTFHRLNGEKFLNMMAGCRAVVCTAGFESVSEAAWLGKPLFMVPVENHVEQMINAMDAVKMGLGITDSSFKLDRLKELPDTTPAREFQEWVDQGETVLARMITQATGRPAREARPEEWHSAPQPVH